MTNSLTHQKCDECGREYTELDPAPRCAACSGLLSIVHPPRRRGDELRAALDADQSPSGVWRFAELVLPSARDIAVSYPEGRTPLLKRPRLSAWCGVEQLLIKHEGHNPTGSFKDRGMTVGMTQAHRIGARAVACASTGNTSASLAAYAALAGLPALAIVPDGQVAIGKLSQTLAYGARTLLVQGDFDDCLRLMQEASAELGVYLLNSINPFRIEGQKTIVFELLQQLKWSAPDWIVLPAGNLGNTAAFGKALNEAFDLGLIDRKPRIAAIQAAGAAPFAAAFRTGFDSLAPVHAETIATAIKIGAPASFRRGAHAITSTNGVVAAVSDAEILDAKIAIDRAGVGCEPASAATLAGIRSLRIAGVIGAHERVAGILTGHILKDPGILQQIHCADSIVSAGQNIPIAIPARLDAVARVLSSISG